MINQDDFNANGHQQSTIGKLNLLGSASFDYQHNLALMAQDLLNETQKFPLNSSDEDSSESEPDEQQVDLNFSTNISTNQVDNPTSKNNNTINNKKRKLKQNSDESKKKPKSQYQRKNIKKIIGEEKLNESTLRALQEEQERQMRLRIDPFQHALKSREELLNKSTSSSEHSILLLDEDPNEINNNTNSLVEKLQSINRMNKNFLKQESQIIEIEDLTQSDNEIIEEDYRTPLARLRKPILQEEDDDDCRILSESEHQQEEASKKKSLRGIHMNDELNRPDQNGQVLVNVNHPIEDDDIYLLPYLAKNIKPHQIGGIRFIYDNIVESLTRVKDKSNGFGCILAHAMGLGKTFQVISFVEVFLRCTGASRVLCIVPINTIQNWQSEFNNWLPEDGQQKLDNDTIINYRRPFRVYLINDCAKTLKQRTDIILDWKQNGGVLLIGYEMFRTLVSLKHQANGKQKKETKKSATQTLTKYLKQDSLIDLEQEENLLIKQNELEEALLTPCLVVCDEGHRIKNSSANIAKTLQRIKTKRRVVLTGYPLQNNLIEYWCMVDFVRPAYLGNKSEFCNMFERPITNGQCVDSTRDDIKLMRYRAHVLHSLLEGFVQRRGHDVFLCSLPKKYEFIILLKLSSIQKELYLAFMQAIGAMNPGEKINPLRTFAICCKIWNHPDVLYKYNQNKEADIDLDLPDIQQQQQQQSNNKQPKKQTNNSPQYIQANSSCVLLEDSGFNPFANSFADSRYNKASFDPEWANRLLENYEADILQNGAKLMVSFSLIEESVLNGDKILLFSQSLLTLNLIEDYLQRIYVPNTNQKWQKYKSYFRLDGSTSGTERERLINQFNKANNGVWLFLLSTRAGCLGINLVGANRVIVLDASWNPCHDAQAVCRVFRYGQQKNSFIYRLIADHTMEKKIYDRQISKQTMSDRVIDEIQSENHFTRTEVEKLIHYVKEDEPAADLSNLPAKYDDRVLINACLKHACVITKEPYTHESLLIDKKEYQLSEREKAMAFKEYQHDKKYFPYSKPSSYSAYYLQRYPISTQMQQQQQVNYNTQSIQSSNLVHQSMSSMNLTSSVTCSSSSSLSSASSTSSSRPSSSSSFNYQSNLSADVNLLNKNGLDFNLHRSISTPTIKSHLNQGPIDLSILSSPQQQLVQAPVQQQQAQQNSNPISQLKDVKITSFVASSQIVIPTSPSSSQGNDQASILIQPGEKVYILKTPKGCYLRTPDKRYIALRNKSIEDSIINNSSSSNDQANYSQTQDQPTDFYQPQQQQQQYYQNTYVQPIDQSNQYIYSNQTYNYYNQYNTSTTASVNTTNLTNTNGDFSLLSTDNFQNQMLSIMQPPTNLNQN